MRYEYKHQPSGNPSFPYDVIDTETGRIVNSYTDWQIAEEAAFRMNRPEVQPTNIYDYDELQEMLDR